MTATLSGRELDRAVVDEFRLGNDEAVRAVYRFYSGSVFAVVASVISDGAAISDVVQQTFVKAWQHADRFDPGRPMGPWIRTIARHTAIDALRSQQRRPSVALTSVAEPAGDPVAFDAVLIAGEVRSALDQLPPEERDILQLAHLEGLSHGEVAQRLGIPIGTVKSRSHRAHRRLAGLLKHLKGEAGGARS